MVFQVKQSYNLMFMRHINQQEVQQDGAALFIQSVCTFGHSCTEEELCPGEHQRSGLIQVVQKTS